MIVIVCVDQRNGLAFNGRRQSRDRMVAADILKESAGRRLWMTPSSRRLFLPEAEIFVDASCCAGVTPQSHRTALEAMKACQITVEHEQ